MPDLTVRKSILINASPVEVWNIIASVDAIRRWMLVTPEVDCDGPLQLGRILRWNGEDGKPYLIATVVTLKPARKLELTLRDPSWTQPNHVTYSLTLSETEKGTELHFLFGDLAIDPEGQQWFDAYSASRELDMIKTMAEGQP